MEKTKRILITGASRGIGKATAIKLAQNGYEIIINYNSGKNQAIETLAEVKVFSSKSKILQFDIKNREECQKVISNDIDNNGIYYGIVLNAGIAKDNIFPTMEDKEWDDVIQTNLGGLYNVLKPIIMPMISNRIKGRIITLSSIAALSGNKGQVNYSAAKAGIIGATKSLALELAKRGITVNCVAPGIIETDMTKNIPTEDLKKIIPMKRIGKPEEIASLINYLLSEEASYITGQVISVNGGLYL